MIGDAVSVGNVYIYTCVPRFRKFVPVTAFRIGGRHENTVQIDDVSTRVAGDEMSADRAEIARKTHGYEPAARRTRTELKTEMADTR